MKKLMIPAIIAMIFLVILYPDRGEAHTVTEINQELEALKREMEAAEQKANEAQNRIETINIEQQKATNDMAQIMEQIDEATAEMGKLQERILKTETELDLTEQQLADAMARVEERNDLIKSRLRLMYMKGNVSYLEVLLNSTSFSDFLSRYEALRMLVGQDKEMLESNQKDEQMITAKKDEMKSLLARLTDDYKQLETMRENLFVQEKKKEVMIASLQKEEEQLEGYTQEQENLLMAAARKQAELNKEKQKLSTVKKTPKNTIGDSDFIYPLPQKYTLTSDFGSRVDPITGRKGAFHNGLDIGAPGGTDVLATSSGDVIVASWYSGYGNAVIIDHGNGVWSLYAHMRSLNVSKGETVAPGDKVGEVGTTGRSTGNHLHFEIRKDEKATDPGNYIVY